MFIYFPALARIPPVESVPKNDEALMPGVVLMSEA